MEITYLKCCLLMTWFKLVNVIVRFGCSINCFFLRFIIMHGFAFGGEALFVFSFFVCFFWRLFPLSIVETRGFNTMLIMNIGYQLYEPLQMSRPHRFFLFKPLFYNMTTIHFDTDSLHGFDLGFVLHIASSQS